MWREGYESWREDSAVLVGAVLAELQDIDQGVSALGVTYEPAREECVMCVRFADKSKTQGPILTSAEILDDCEPSDVAHILYKVYEMQTIRGNR